MNWIRENKFLSLYLLLLLIGFFSAGGFYLISWGKYKSVVEKYDALNQQATRLKKQSLYPNSQNLEALEALYQATQESTIALAKERNALPSNQLPDLNSESFLEFLNNAVKNIEKQCEDKNISLPENFYLGLERFRNRLPSEEAIPTAGFLTKAVEHFLKILMSENIISLEKLSFVGKLPGIDLPSKSSEESAQSDGQKLGVIDTYSFELIFVAGQHSLEGVMNQIVSQKDYFYDIRLLEIQNENTEGPEKNMEETEVRDEEDDVMLVSEKEKDAKLILGNEKLTFKAKINLLRFIAPQSTEAPSS